jgi:hypothetical protein
MAIGLKLRDVRRFGQKVQKGVKTFARKLGSTAEQVGNVVAPIAGLVAGKAGEEAVEGAVAGVKGFAGGLQALTGKGVSKGTRLFQQAQQPILGVQEIAKAIKNPKTAKVVIGDVVANRFKGQKPSIQREESFAEM